MGWETEIDDVVSGEPIESVWGNEIRDKVVHVVATEAALPTDVAEGSVAWIQSTNRLQYFDGTSWSLVGGGVLAYAETTTGQSGIGSSATDLTGLTVTVTVPASRRIRISGLAQIQQQSTTGVVTGNMQEGSTGLGRFYRGSLGANQSAIAYGAAILSPSAGAHTYKLTLATTAGTVDMQAAATIPAYILAEDIGPV